MWACSAISKAGIWPVRLRNLNRVVLKKPHLLGLFLFLSLWLGVSFGGESPKQLPSEVYERLQYLDYDVLAHKIEQNETGGKDRYLTYWSKREAFPSFGIGHFIWIPSGVEVPFEQTFPQMLGFVSAIQSAPTWLLQQPNLPWSTRDAFEKAQDSKEMVALRNWLKQTKALQAQFIYHRFLQQLENTLPKLSQQQRRTVSQQILSLLQSEAGIFAMIDYVNFKGMGHNTKEQYQQVGWGLMEVLLGMPMKSTPSSAESALTEFIQSAKQRLKRRTELAPPERKEQRWLPGWNQRLENYKTSVSSSQE